MAQKIDIEQMRKASAQYAVGAEQVLKTMLNTMSRSKSGDSEAMRLQAEAVTAARVAGQNDVIPFILRIHEHLRSAWLAHSVMWHGTTENEAKIPLPKQSAFLEALSDCIIELRKAIDELDTVAGLGSPIETLPEAKGPSKSPVPPMAEKRFTKSDLCNMTGYSDSMVSARLKQLGIKSAPGGRPKKDDRPYSDSQAKALLCSIINDDGAQEYQKEQCRKSLETLD